MATTLPPIAAATKQSALFKFIRRNPTIVFGTALLVFMTLVAVAAPHIAGDPLFQAPVNRLRAPDAQNWFGTDHLGRDVFARTVHGTRISLIVGITVATISVSIGLVIGLLIGRR